MASALTPVLIATGAFDCGKTTTLEHLRDHHGMRIHGEAHRSAIAALGARTKGHPPDQPFAPIEDPDHFCPMCRPWAFAQMVLEIQARIEARARPQDLLERGYLDPIEMLLRNTDTPDDGPRPPWHPVARYQKVFLFELMPELQRPRWGKSVERRAAEAALINRRLARLYRAAGHEVIQVRPGSVAERADTILSQLE